MTFDRTGGFCCARPSRIRLRRNSGKFGSAPLSNRLPDRKSLTLELQVSTLRPDRSKIIRGLVVAGFGPGAVRSMLGSFTSEGVSDSYPRSRCFRARLLLTTAYWTTVSFFFFVHNFIFFNRHPSFCLLDQRSRLFAGLKAPAVSP